MKFNYPADANQSKSRKKVRVGRLPSFSFKTRRDEINWSKDFSSNMFSLEFDNLFNNINFEMILILEC